MHKLNSTITTYVASMVMLSGCGSTPQEPIKEVQFPPAIRLTDPLNKVVDSVTNKARSAFDEGRYEDLDKMAATYRVNKEELSNGAWKLDLVYDAVGSVSGDDAAWKARERKLTEWNEKTHSVTSAVAMAAFMQSYAWNARGNGYADTVSDDSWKLFKSRLEESVKWLREAKKRGECPHMYSTGVGTMMGLSVDQKEVFKALTACEKNYPGYYAVYSNLVNYLLPRWFGRDADGNSSYQPLADFLNAPRTKLSANDADMLYARLVYDAVYYYGENYRELKIDSDRLKKGYGLLAEKFSNSDLPAGRYCQIAMKVPDYPAARECFTKLNGHCPDSLWNNRWAYIRDRYRAFYQ